MNDMRRVRCKRCKEFYVYEIGLPPEFCPDCEKERQGQAQLLRDIVWENRGITGFELHEMTGIPIEVVMKHVDDGLLEVAPEEVAVFRGPLKKNDKWHSGAGKDKRRR